MHPDQLEAALTQCLGPAGVLTGADATPYATDWRGLLHGHARLVIRPATTEQVAEAVALCAAASAPIVPQGGNTGLAGGATPDDTGRQVILSLSRLNRIRALDPEGMTLTAEAGATLQSLQDTAKASGLRLPITLASQGTAQLGGILSTNAGGNNTLRHGNTRDLALGLEVVLTDGRIWHGLRALRKDNTGYALRHLFMGAEGTLGIITAATLGLVPAHRATEVALAAIASPQAALRLLRLLQAADEEALHAYEYISGDALRLVLETIDGTRNPFPASYDHYALIEFATSRRQADLRTKLEQVLGQALEQHLAHDAVLAENGAQRAALWRLREEQAEAERRAGPTLKNDISVPVSATPILIERATKSCKELAQGVRIVPFGHLGDGNIHFNLVAPPGAGPDWLADPGGMLIHTVTEIARSLGGSFSAEHGIGQLKTGLLAEWRKGVELDLMWAIKAALDPHALLNPGKLLKARDKRLPGSPRDRS